MPRIVDIPLQGEQLDELASNLLEKFQMSVTARSSQIDDKYVRWKKNYAGIPAQEVRTSPFNRASNFMPQLIRMHNDILGARILGIITATKPFWMVRSHIKDQLPHDTLESLGEGVNGMFDLDLEWYPTTDEIINQSLETGTLTSKLIWSETTESILKTDSDGEFDEREIQKMEYDQVPFEDFWPFPITATSTDKAEICFHRIRLTERGVRERGKDGRWNPETAKKMLPESKIDNVAEATAQSSGINLTADVGYPYSAIEASLKYDIGGKLRPIIVVFNPQRTGKDSILRAYYNFMPNAKLFVDFKPMPRRGSFYGYSVPEILEQSQEECAQIHNARRDANMIANVPMWKKKRYADVPNPATEAFPGAVIEVDDMSDLEQIQWAGNYNSMLDEEQFVMSGAETLIGISAAMQGFGAGQAGKRGVYNTGGTMALLSEGNQRLDIFIRRLRYPFHHIANSTMMAYRQFNPTYFDQFGAKKANAIRSALDAGHGKLLFDFSASEASSNREIDRQNLLQMANVIGPYYEKIIQAGQLYATLQPNDPLREGVRLVLDGARDLANRILFAFDVGDRQRIIPNFGELLGQDPGAGPAMGQGGLSSPAAALQPSQLEDLLARTQAVSGRSYEPN